MDGKARTIGGKNELAANTQFNIILHNLKIIQSNTNYLWLFLPIIIFF